MEVESKLKYEIDYYFLNVNFYSFQYKIKIIIKFNLKIIKYNLKLMSFKIILLLLHVSVLFSRNV